MSRILKARYFPSSSFFESGLGNAPSFIWRSILWGRNVLSKGVRWRIGDGSAVSISGDPWIPRDNFFGVLSPRVLPAGEAVGGLILEAGRWDKELVQRCFDPEEANLILGIPLSLNPRPDSYCWNFDRNGFFSVKSAYRLALILQGSGVASSSNGPHFLWKFLWNLNLPSKIKILSWKACKEIIPTRALLAKRGIINNGNCLLCDDGWESVEHVFWDCGWVKSVWVDCPLQVELSKIRFADFFDRVAFLASTRSKEEVRVFLVAVWLLWTRRNLFVHESVCLSTDSVWSKAVAYVQDFDVACAQKAPPSVSSGSGLQCWVPPPPDVFKLNVDAAFDKLNSKIGLGMVVRNAGGDVVLAAALSFKGGTSVVVGEAQAVLEGILLAGNRGFRPLLVESDCLNVVNLCNSNITVLCEIGNVVTDIKLALGWFEVLSIGFVPRVSNSVGHGIARWALGFNCSTIWSCNFPS
ncbi:hypothetical protein ACOSP7_021340 [Xanthoceras sorbifolium]